MRNDGATICQFVPFMGQYRDGTRCEALRGLAGFVPGAGRVLKGRGSSPYRN